jgi:hypothetical protein
VAASQENTMASINYYSAAAAIDPLASFSGSTDPTIYETLLWYSTPIPKATLEASFLQTAKLAQVAKISAAMLAEVYGGFLVDVFGDGVQRKYASDVQGQVAIIGAVTLLKPSEGLAVPATYDLATMDPNTGLPIFVPHNAQQAYAVLLGLKDFSNFHIDHLKSTMMQVMTVNTGNINADLDTVASITWTS